MLITLGECSLHDVFPSVFLNFGHEVVAESMVAHPCEIFVAGCVTSEADLDELVQYAKETKENGTPLTEDSRVADGIADFAIYTRISRLAELCPISRIENLSGHLATRRSICASSSG